MQNVLITRVWIAMVCAMPGLVSACGLTEMPVHLQRPELRSSIESYAVSDYRNQLLRYVSGDYARIADDLLRGSGSYLDALHVLMGSVDTQCTAQYRDLLLAHTGAREFALALWQFRTRADGVSTEVP